MKLLARILLPLALLALAFYAGYSTAIYGRHGFLPFGHHAHDSEAHREARFARMSKKLKLTPEQEVKVRAIFEERGEKLQLLRSTVHPQFQAIRKETREKILAVLNPEQSKLFKKFLEKKKRWREKHKKDGKRFRHWLGKHHPPAPPPPPPGEETPPS